MKLQSMKPLIRQLPILTHLTSTKNTIVVCTVCRGTRLNAIKSDHTNTIRYVYCRHCRGTGTMSNNPDKYDGVRLPVGL